MTFRVRRGGRGTCRLTQRHDPDVRRLGVGFEIDVDHAEDHPLAVGRNLRLAHALQLHHVVEGEGMLGLSDGGKCECEHRRDRRKRRMRALLGKRKSVAGDGFAASSFYPQPKPCHPEARGFLRADLCTRRKLRCGWRVHRSFGGQSLPQDDTAFMALGGTEATPSNLRLFAPGIDQANAAVLEIGGVAGSESRAAWTRAMAAICASNWLMGRPRERRLTAIGAKARAASSSKGRIRPAKNLRKHGSRRVQQAVRDACPEAAVRFPKKSPPCVTAGGEQLSPGLLLSSHPRQHRRL